MSSRNKDNRLFVKLEDVLEEVKVDLGLSTNNKDLQLFQWIIRAVRSLAISSQTETKVKFLPINQVNTVILPVDYFDLVRIGVLCGDKIKYYTQYMNMAKMLGVDNCGQEYYDTTKACCEQKNKEFEVEFGHYRIDIPNGIIRLSQHLNFGENDKVYLEYITNGTEVDGDLLIRSSAMQTVIDYVHWQNSLFPRMTQESVKRETIYKDSLKKLNRMNNPLSIADIREVVNKNMYYEPKW